MYELNRIYWFELQKIGLDNLANKVSSSNLLNLNLQKLTAFIIN